MQINPDIKSNHTKSKEVKKFQSYQFMQINPDNLSQNQLITILLEFQSYQFMQINPDVAENSAAPKMKPAVFQSYQFRQINPDTYKVHNERAIMYAFQSYQFRQINPDQKEVKPIAVCIRGFNRINSGRSIPTLQNT